MQRKSRRGAKPSTKLLESKGIPATKWDPLVPDKVVAKEHQKQEEEAGLDVVNGGEGLEEEDVAMGDAGDDEENNENDDQEEEEEEEEEEGNNNSKKKNNNNEELNESQKQQQRPARRGGAVGTKKKAHIVRQINIRLRKQEEDQKRKEEMEKKALAGKALQLVQTGRLAGRGQKQSQQTLEDPLAKRARALASQRKHFQRFVERLTKFDPYGLILGERLGGEKLPKGMLALGDIIQRAEEGKYSCEGVNEFEWLSSRASVAILKKLPQGFDDKNPLQRSDLLAIDYDAFVEDIDEMCKYVFDQEESDEEEDEGQGQQGSSSRTQTGIVKKIKEHVMDHLTTMREKHEEEIKKVKEMERFDRLSLENREPAMKGWRKKPIEKRQYTTSNAYQVVKGLTSEESKRLIAKLTVGDQSVNRWIHVPIPSSSSGKNGKGKQQDDLNEVLKHETKRRKEEEQQEPQSASIDEDENNPDAWKVKELGLDIEEVDTWGIDPFARRNIQIALESVADPNLCMTQPQIQWFIEGILLREVNAQEPQVSYDIRNALYSIKRRILKELGREEDLQELERVMAETKSIPARDIEEVNPNSPSKPIKIIRKKKRNAIPTARFGSRRKKGGRKKKASETSSLSSSIKKEDNADEEEEEEGDKDNITAATTTTPKPGEDEENEDDDDEEEEDDENKNNNDSMEIDGTTSTAAGNNDEDENDEVKNDDDHDNSKQQKRKLENAEAQEGGGVALATKKQNQDEGKDAKKQKVKEETPGDDFVFDPKPKRLAVEPTNIIWNSSGRSRKKPDFFGTGEVETSPSAKKKSPQAKSPAASKKGGSTKSSNKKKKQGGKGKKNDDEIKEDDEKEEEEDDNVEEEEATVASSRRRASRQKASKSLKNSDHEEIQQQPKAENNNNSKTSKKKGGNKKLQEVDDDNENKDDSNNHKNARSSSTKSRKSSASGGSSSRKRKIRTFESSSKRVAKGDIVGQRIQVFWPLDCMWYWGRVVEYSESPPQEGKHHRVLYDDGAEEWVDIDKERCILEDSKKTLFDRDIPPEVILAGADTLLESVKSWGMHMFCIHPKGVGIVCKNDQGIHEGDLVGPYLGELYPLWLWEQKEAREDAERRAAQGAGKVILPDFWNMRMDIPAEDSGGFFMMYVDAKYFGNIAGRLSHSCNPNCGAMLAIRNGEYQVCMRALRDIEPGEELCIDYNCVTDSMDEFRAAICLCGTQACRGSFLYITGAQQYMQVVNRRHRPIHRVALLYQASFEGVPDFHDDEDDFPPPTPQYNSAVQQPPQTGTPPVVATSGSSQVAEKTEATTGQQGPTPMEIETSQAQPRPAVQQQEQQQPTTVMKLDEEGEEGSKPAEVYGVPGISELDAASAKRLASFGLKFNALEMLPVWLLRYCGLALRFVELEQLELPVRLFHEEMERRKLRTRTQAEDLADIDASAGTTGNSASLQAKRKSKKKASPTNGGEPSTVDDESARDLWENVKREAKGVGQQRVSNLIISLDKVRHRINTRIDWGVDPLGSQQLYRPTKAESSGMNAPGSPRLQSLVEHETKMKALIADVNRKMVERVWWVGDRCEAKWCGDDSDKYPGWYSGTILHVHPRGFGRDKTPAIHFLYDEGEVIDKIHIHPSIIRRPKVPESKLDELYNSPAPSRMANSTVTSLTKTRIKSDSVASNQQQHQQTEQEAQQHQQPAAAAVQRSQGNEVFETPTKQYPSHMMQEMSSNNAARKNIFTPTKNMEDKDVEFPKPFTGMSCNTHQSPFTPLVKDNIVELLWNHENSIANRLVRLLEKHCIFTCPAWQKVEVPRLRGPYWYNVQTRATLKEPPSSEQAQERFEHIPEPYRRIKDLVTMRKVKSPMEAREALRQVRDHMLRMPSVRYEPKDGSVRLDQDLEDAHQKAIDLLTFYSSTRNYFVVNEAEAMDEDNNPWLAFLQEHSNQFSGRSVERSSFLNRGAEGGIGGGSSSSSSTTNDVRREVGAGSRSSSKKALEALLHKNIHESCVSAPILAWLDQKESENVVSSLVGTAVIPIIESAYVKAGVNGSTRNKNNNNNTEMGNFTEARIKLLRHLEDPQKRYEHWDEQLKSQFPDTAEPMISKDSETWPPPLPPPKMYGSPIMDAAIHDNREFSKLLGSLRGTIDDVSAKDVLEELGQTASTRGNGILVNLCAELRSSRRLYNTKIVRSNERFIPPIAPFVCEYVWLQCDHKHCQRWRKLPPGFSSSDFSDPFYCEHLEFLDPEYSSCLVPEEVNTNSEKWGYGIKYGVEGLRPGHRVDAYCDFLKKWIAAEVADTRAAEICVQWPKILQLPNEWLPKRPPVKGDPPFILPLYTNSLRSQDTEERGFRYITVEKMEPSKFGSECKPDDYRAIVMGVEEEVLHSLCSMLNKVSETNGEPLGQVKVKTTQKVVITNVDKQQKKELLMHLQRQNQQKKPMNAKRMKEKMKEKKKHMERDSVFTFFKDMKATTGDKLGYHEAMEQSDMLNNQQIEMWNPQTWSSTRYEAWLDDVVDEDIGSSSSPYDGDCEQSEQHLMIGMIVLTPCGEGIVVKRTGTRKYIIAVKPLVDMQVSTPFGRGYVREVSMDGTIATVELKWGAKLFAYDLAIYHEFYCAVPMYPFLCARTQNKPVISLANPARLPDLQLAAISGK